MNTAKLDAILENLPDDDKGDIKWGLYRAYALGVEDSREVIDKAQAWEDTVMFHDAQDVLSSIKVELAELTIIK